MPKKIVIINGSPVRDGNTAMLINWFSEGARGQGAEIEIISTAFLKIKATGCTSCRLCQTAEEYKCVIEDDAAPVLAKMAGVVAEGGLRGHGGLRFRLTLHESRARPIGAKVQAGRSIRSRSTGSLPP